jgi:hypothetical protein
MKVTKSNRTKLLILACAVMENEIRQFRNGQVEFRIFDYGLHRTPENMAKALQGEIDEISEEDCDGIVLGYGLCSNGIVGIHSKKHPLIIPRIHDCITLFLGSLRSYQNESAEHPGTYYLTPGWIEKGETPLSKYEKTARWVLHEEMKNYTRIAFINTGVHEIDFYRKIAQQNAKFLNISFQELESCPTFFRELVCGPWGKNFLIIEKGNSVRQEMFLDL